MSEPDFPDDVPRSMPVSGPPREIQKQFTEYSVPRLAAWVLGIIGVVVALAGVILFVVPVLVVGVLILVVAGLAFYAGRAAMR